MKNKKKITLIVLAITIITVAVIIIVLTAGRKNNSGTDNNTTSENENNITPDITEAMPDEIIGETITGKDGQIIMPDKTDDMRTSESSENVTAQPGAGINEMDDIFTDKAIENTTTKKNDNHDNKDKNEETDTLSDGWSDFY